ncbi:MAG TPA: hypothetical protein VGK16_10455 [Candidatus Limnocylindrales bacterium]
MACGPGCGAIRSICAYAALALQGLQFAALIQGQVGLGAPASHFGGRRWPFAWT